MSLRSLAGGSAAVVLMSTAGCGGLGDAEVGQTARAFHEALGSRDGAAACELLAPPTRSELEDSSGSPCAEAILQEGIQTATAEESVDVYGTMAQVRSGQDITVLTRYDDGWTVYAAGCAPDPSSSADAARYDCQVKGG